VSLVGKGRPANAPVAANAALRRTSSSEEMIMSSERTRRRTFYQDWGSGQPIVFSHGWPLSDLRCIVFQVTQVSPVC